MSFTTHHLLVHSEYALFGHRMKHICQIMILFLAGKKETDGLTHLSVAKQNSLLSGFCDFLVFHVVLLEIIKVGV